MAMPCSEQQSPPQPQEDPQTLSHKTQVPLPHPLIKPYSTCIVLLRKIPLNTLHQSSDLHPITAEVSKCSPFFPLDLRCL